MTRDTGRETRQKFDLELDDGMSVSRGVKEFLEVRMILLDALTRAAVR